MSDEPSVQQPLDRMASVMTEAFPLSSQVWPTINLHQPAMRGGGGVQWFRNVLVVYFDEEFTLAPTSLVYRMQQLWQKAEHLARICEKSQRPSGALNPSFTQLYLFVSIWIQNSIWLKTVQVPFKHLDLVQTKTCLGGAKKFEVFERAAIQTVVDFNFREIRCNNNVPLRMLFIIFPLKYS